MSLYFEVMPIYQSAVQSLAKSLLFLSYKQYHRDLCVFLKAVETIRASAEQEDTVEKICIKGYTVTLNSNSLLMA